MRDYNELWKTLYDLSNTAATNQCYYRHVLTQAEADDSRIRLAVGVVAIVSLFVGVVSLYRAKDAALSFIAQRIPWPGLLDWLTWEKISVGVAFVAIIVAWALNESPETSPLVRYADQYRRWCDLRTDADNLYQMVQGLPRDKLPADLEEQIRTLVSRKNQTNAFDREPDEALLKKCAEDVDESMSGSRTQEEKDEKDKAAKRRANGEAASNGRLLTKCVACG